MSAVGCAPEMENLTEENAAPLEMTKPETRCKYLNKASIPWVVMVIAVVTMIALLVVRIGHENKLTEIENSLLKQNGVLVQLQKDNEQANNNQTAHVTRALMVMQYELSKATLHYAEGQTATEAEFIIRGYEEASHIGNIGVHLIGRRYFEVQKRGIYSITAKVAFVGFYRNAAIGIYVDDVLYDKSLSSAFLSQDPTDQYTNVITCQVQCLHVEVKEGQTITIRSFHNKTIYKGDKTNWVHIERH